MLETYTTVQNKMHFAVHGNTAAEVIVARANYEKDYMGLTSWKNAPDGKIMKTDVSIAKNYLYREEMQEANSKSIESFRINYIRVILTSLWQKQMIWIERKIRIERIVNGEEKIIHV